jgi:hypothetical protein
VIRPTVLTGWDTYGGGDKDTGPNLVLSQHKGLAPSVLLENFTGQKPCTALYNLQVFGLQMEEITSYLMVSGEPIE